jgi:predicted ABC-type ATPase
MDQPNVIILAGPNGAGKSTMSTALFASTLEDGHFVNADTIARGLSAFRSEEMAFEAGRVMLQHMKQLAARRANFAFETTLATKSFAPWLAKLKNEGYQFRLFFLWLLSAEEAVQRVHHRKQTGGHFVPEETVRRRYERGLENFFRLYQPLADSWQFFNNSSAKSPVLLAEGEGTIETVHDTETYTRIKREHTHG